jgi:hypothetical protein
LPKKTTFSDETPLHVLNNKTADLLTQHQAYRYKSVMTCTSNLSSINQLHCTMSEWGENRAISECVEIKQNP